MKTLGKGQVFIGPIDASPHRFEFSGDDWKVVGYAEDIELKQENEYEDIAYAPFLPSFKALSEQKTTVTFKVANVDNKLFELMTGLPKPKTPVERVKDVLRGKLT